MMITDAVEKEDDENEGEEEGKRMKCIRSGGRRNNTTNRESPEIITGDEYEASTNEKRK